GEGVRAGIGRTAPTGLGGISPLNTLLLAATGITFTRRARGTCRSIRHERIRLARDVALPHRVAIAARGVLALGLGLPRVEIGVRRELRQAHADHVGDALETLLVHEAREARAQALDHLVPLEHRARADLHRVRADQEELCR